MYHQLTLWPGSHSRVPLSSKVLLLPQKYLSSKLQSSTSDVMAHFQTNHQFFFSICLENHTELIKRKTKQVFAFGGRNTGARIPELKTCAPQQNDLKTLFMSELLFKRSKTNSNTCHSCVSCCGCPTSQKCAAPTWDLEVIAMECGRLLFFYQELHTYSLLLIRNTDFPLVD